jgi:hypothetical protein
VRLSEEIVKSVFFVTFVFLSVSLAQKSPTLPPETARTRDLIERAFAAKRTPIDCHWTSTIYYCSKYVTGGTKVAKKITDAAIGRYASGSWGQIPYFGGKLWNRNFEMPSGAGFNVFLSLPDAETKVNIQIQLYSTP